MHSSRSVAQTGIADLMLLFRGISSEGRTAGRHFPSEAVATKLMEQ
jgi:hypothetical protein